MPTLPSDDFVVGLPSHAPTSLLNYPCVEFCHTSQASEASVCSICLGVIGYKDWIITHNNCLNSCCRSCALSWIDFTQTERTDITCPFCQTSVGRLMDTRRKTWIVETLESLQLIVGRAFTEESLVDRRGGAINLEDVAWEAAHEDYTSNCPYLTPHTHDDLQGECPVNLHSILALADQIGEFIRFGDTTAVSALAEFTLAAAMHGEPHAVQLALTSPWVSNQLLARRRVRAAEESRRFLFTMNKQMGVRQFETYVFEDFDPKTTFYVPCAPTLRALATIQDLRDVVMPSVVVPSPNQTGEWLQLPSKAVFSTQDLFSLFDVDTSDSYTMSNLVNVPKKFNLEGWAVFRYDDKDYDYVWAVPRVYVQSDLALRKPEAYFILANGQPEKLQTRDIDFNKLPARMIDLWEYNYIFKPEIDSP